MLALQRLELDAGRDHDVGDGVRAADVAVQPVIELALTALGSPLGRQRGSSRGSRSTRWERRRRFGPSCRSCPRRRSPSRCWRAAGGRPSCLPGASRTCRWRPTWRCRINSIKTYIRSAYRKVGISHRAQAVAWAMQNGFPPPTERTSAPRRSHPVVVNLHPVRVATPSFVVPQMRRQGHGRNKNRPTPARVGRSLGICTGCLSRSEMVAVTGEPDGHRGAPALGGAARDHLLAGSSFACQVSREP
jgi:hypothetical protein